MTSNLWDPSQALRADASDEQIWARAKCRRDASWAAGMTSNETPEVAREFANSCVATEILRAAGEELRVEERVLASVRAALDDLAQSPPRNSAAVLSLKLILSYGFQPVPTLTTPGDGQTAITQPAASLPHGPARRWQEDETLIAKYRDVIGMVEGRKPVSHRGDIFAAMRALCDDIWTAACSPRGAEIVVDDDEKCARCFERKATMETEFMGPLCAECYIEALEGICERKDADAITRRATLVAWCERQRIPMDDEISTAYNNGVADCLRGIMAPDESPPSPSPEARKP